jgi:hypothetical protein
MSDIVTVLQNITSIGIIGILLIFIAIFMLVSVCSWTIAKYTKSKNDIGVIKNKISKTKITKE